MSPVWALKQAPCLETTGSGLNLGGDVDTRYLPRAYDPAIGGEGAFLKWGAVVSAECTSCTVVIAQTRHKDFIRRLFSIFVFGVVCELEGFPEGSSGDQREPGDVDLHLSILEARDVDLYGGRHSACWCYLACKSGGTVKVVEKGEWEGVNPTSHHQRHQRESSFIAAEKR